MWDVRDWWVSLCPVILVGDTIPHAEALVILVIGPLKPTRALIRADYWMSFEHCY